MSAAVRLDPRSGAQVDRAIARLRAALADDLVAVWLSGSAVHGGLKPSSDLDLIAISRRPTARAEQRVLVDGLLEISGRRATAGPARSIELSVVVDADVRPWRFPPRLDFQYGDWWRPEFEAGELQPWTTPNPDLAILLATALLAAHPLLGPPPAKVLERVPRDDLVRAMLDGIPGLLAELETDTRNVVLTLARIWMTLETGQIVAKDVAAGWALARLPAEQHEVLSRARANYLGEAEERWEDLRPAVRDQAARLVEEIGRVSRTPARR
jgi:streptomycin 3"-adenylyltransferase